jgi:DNA-binding beta-propeller fold protein YncE
VKNKSRTSSLYHLARDWKPAIPAGWSWGWVSSVACDSDDRLFVHSRSEHPLLVFDPEGELLDSWGDDFLEPEQAHGVFVDSRDNVFCTELSHCVYRFNSNGTLTMTIGTPGKASSMDRVPFNKPTDVAEDEDGNIYVSDGYENHCVHKFDGDGNWINSWGEEGDNPGQFATVHCVRLDRYGRIWVCDRENNRVQIFDSEMKFIEQWTDLNRPCSLVFNDRKNVVCVAEIDHRVSIWRLDGKLVECLSDGDEGNALFAGYPHGICIDSSGALYVAEVGMDGRLQKFLPNASMEILEAT